MIDQNGRVKNETGGTRTRDPSIKSAVLYQLSYGLNHVGRSQRSPSFYRRPSDCGRTPMLSFSRPKKMGGFRGGGLAAAVRLTIHRRKVPLLRSQPGRFSAKLPVSSNLALLFFLP
jgi:hypothetical protein